MQGADKGHSNRLDGNDLRVGIVQARFNDELTSRLAEVCIDELLKLGVNRKHIEHVTVPGALEIPLVLQTMARSGKFHALVALGAVIRGETYHFELVANESGASVSRRSWARRPGASIRSRAGMSSENELSDSPTFCSTALAINAMSSMVSDS